MNAALASSSESAIPLFGDDAGTIRAHDRKSWCCRAPTADLYAVPITSPITGSSAASHLPSILAVVAAAPHAWWLGLTFAKAVIPDEALQKLSLGASAATGKKSASVHDVWMADLNCLADQARRSFARAG